MSPICKLLRMHSDPSYHPQETIAAIATTAASFRSEKFGLAFTAWSRNGESLVSVKSIPSLSPVKARARSYMKSVCMDSF